MNKESAPSIVNRVSKSAIEVLSLTDFTPPSWKRIKSIDIKEGMDGEGLLREKPFRLWVKQMDVEAYRGHFVGVYCSVAHAIVPVWAYMLLASRIGEYAEEIFYGNAFEVQKALFLRHMNTISWSDYDHKRVMLRGCAPEPITTWAYTYITKRLISHVASLMYGEPCSAVPIYKKGRTASSHPS